MEENKSKIFETTDLENRKVIDYKSIETTFDPEGVLTLNKNNGVLTWNSSDITHCNFINDDFTIMYDAESNILTFTVKDKNVYYDLETFKKLILEEGLTIEEMQKILDEKEGKKDE